MLFFTLHLQCLVPSDKISETGIDQHTAECSHSHDPDVSYANETQLTVHMLGKKQLQQVGLGNGHY